MKLAWLTDIHLDQLRYDNRIEFYKKIKDANVDDILITGDIGDGETFEIFLNEMHKNTNKCIYYVLGNHDYYFRSVKEVRDKSLSRPCEYIHMNGLLHAYSNHPSLRIIGQDCWADGRNGDWSNSHIVLHDSKYIEELAAAKKKDMWDMDQDNGHACKNRHLLKKMQELADFDASELENKIHESLRCPVKDRPSKIIILMHVPPFPENAFYNGKMSDDNYLPFYSSKVTGDTLLRACGEYPGIEFLALCGHSHGKSIYQPIPNLTVKCGEAEYGKPTIQEIIEI